MNAVAAFLLENWYMESNWGDNSVGASCEGTRVPEDRSGNRNYSTFHLSFLIDAQRSCLFIMISIRSQSDSV